MKMVVRIHGQGKVKDMGHRGLAAISVAESVDVNVANIPVGLNAAGVVHDSSL